MRVVRHGANHSVISYMTWGDRHEANTCYGKTRIKSFARKTVTGDDTMGIKDLIGKVEYGPGKTLADRLPAATLKKIRSDFREVVKAKKAGKSTPCISDIVRFVKSEYNVKMDRGTATRWLECAREELGWQK